MNPWILFYKSVTTAVLEGEIFSVRSGIGLHKTGNISFNIDPILGMFLKYSNIPLQ